MYVYSGDNMRKGKYLIILVFLIITLIGCNYEYLDQSSFANSDEPELITVYLNGEINLPGEYKISPYTSLNQLISFAGGFLPNYNKEGVDYSIKLYDGQIINFYNNNDTNQEGKININLANKEQLMTLPNIGEVTALNIINYRNNIGKFFSVDQLIEVSGIGQKKLNEIKEYITV